MATTTKKRRGMSKAEYLGGFPVEGVTCAQCGNEACLIYPDPSCSGLAEGAPQKHRPSTVCPNCSVPANESFLRFAAERDGFKLKPVSVFGEVRPPEIERMQSLLDQAGDQNAIADLEEYWGAIKDGSDYIALFQRGEDGRLIYYDDGPRPSHALAALFDVERHLQGKATVLDWGESA